MVGAGCSGEPSGELPNVEGGYTVRAPDATSEPAPPASVARDYTWPNAESRANSDPWLHENHDKIRRLKPKVLVINFANGIGARGEDNIDDGPLSRERIQESANSFVTMLRESSRYQPRRHAGVRPFVEPEIAKIINLQDASRHANSKYFPRGPVNPETGYPTVGYRELFSETFAPYLGFEEGGRFLTLGEALDRGLFHEIVMMANQVDPRAPNPADQVTDHILEVAFVAQAVDANGVPIPGEYVRNGTAPDRQKVPAEQASHDEHNTIPWLGRSIRIFFQNVQRGPGCALHAFGHALEFQYNESTVHAPDAPYHGASVNPWLQPLFRKYADFDMRSRYASSMLDFDSLYSDRGADNYSYSSCGAGGCSTLEYGPKEARKQLADYRPTCGNVHYPPGASRGYDYEPKDAVFSTCESFQRPDERPEVFSRQNWSYLTEDTRIDDDCGGKFLVYWLQNMPNRGNGAVDFEGRAMKNWWPYFYY